VADETLHGHGPPEKGQLYAIRQRYASGESKVIMMGLKCVGFDQNLYGQLQVSMDGVATSKRGGEGMNDPRAAKKVKNS
jgi:hypothetical protein